MESVRAALHEAIQASVAEDDDLNGSMLMGFVCIAEFMDPEGSRWLSVVSGDARGEQAPDWQVEGYLHNRLFETMVVVPGDED